MKKPWLSKTLWTNIFLAAACFSPGAEDFNRHYPQAIPAAVALINIALRMVTHERIGLSDA